MQANGPLIGAVTVRRVLEAYGALFAHRMGCWRWLLAGDGKSANSAP